MMFNDECDNKHKTIATLYELIYDLERVEEEKHGFYISEYKKKIILRYLKELENIRVELKEISKELEVYKESLDWLADRCETLDKIANPTYESICFKAKRWKEIALREAKELSEGG